MRWGDLGSISPRIRLEGIRSEFTSGRFPDVAHQSRFCHDWCVHRTSFPAPRGPHTYTLYREWVYGLGDHESGILLRSMRRSAYGTYRGYRVSNSASLPA